MNTADFTSSNAVAATVTTVVSAWLLVAAASMVSSPTDTQVARGSSVTVSPAPARMSADAVPAVAAAAPDAHFRVVVEARRA